MFSDLERQLLDFVSDYLATVTQPEREEERSLLQRAFLLAQFAQQTRIQRERFDEYLGTAGVKPGK